MARPLPPMPDPDGLAPTKFAYIGAPDRIPNAETLNFLDAVKEGFVPNTLPGFATFTYWWTRSTPVKIAAGQYEFVAWGSKLAGVPYDAALNQAKNAAVTWGGDPTACVAALDARYGGSSSGAVIDWLGRSWYPASSAAGASSLSGGYTDFVENPDGTKTLTLKNGTVIKWGTGPKGQGPAPVKLYQTIPEIVYQSIGPNAYSGHWPTLAWRTITREVNASGGIVSGVVRTTSWTSWKTGMLGPLSSLGVSVADWEKVVDGCEGRRGMTGTSQIANERSYWDYDNLKRAVESTSPGSPPSLNWSEVAAAPPPPVAPPVATVGIPPHGDIYIPPGTPVTTAIDGTLVPNVVAQNQPPLLLTGGGTPSPEQQEPPGGITPPVSPADGLARFGQGLGLVLMAGVGYYLWNKRR